MAKSSPKYQPSPLIHKSYWKVSPDYWGRSLCSLKGSMYLPADPTTARRRWKTSIQKPCISRIFCDFSKPFIFFCWPYGLHVLVSTRSSTSRAKQTISFWLKTGRFSWVYSSRLFFFDNVVFKRTQKNRIFENSIFFLKHSKNKKIESLKILPSGQPWTCTAVNAAVILTSYVRTLTGILLYAERDILPIMLQYI